MKRYFAVTVDNKVINTTVVDKDTVEESLTFLNEFFAVENGTWRYCDVTLPQHKHCGVNATYNAEGDYYHVDQPSENWTYSMTNYRWEPNVPYPDGEFNDDHSQNAYEWDEATTSWIEKT